MKRLALRPRADADLIEIAHWYERQGGTALAGRFFDDARASAEQIATMPGVGSPRFGQIVGMVGLRSWPLKQFPVRWFYVEQPDFIDLIRLLGERQDLAAILLAEKVDPGVDLPEVDR